MTSDPTSDWVLIETREVIVEAYAATGPVPPAEPLTGPEATEGLREGFQRYKVLPGTRGRAQKVEGTDQVFWLVEGLGPYRMAVSEKRFGEWFRVYSPE